MKTISSSIYQAFGLVVVAFVAPLSQVQAVMPPPHGGYPNFTTAAGDHALQALTSGVGNTAIGTFSLFTSRPATSTRLLALHRLILIKPIQIRPPARQRFCLTQLALKIQLWEQPHLNSTIAGMKTRRLEPLRFLATPAAPPTQPPAFKALFSNTTGPDNTAIGVQALFSNTSGGNNTATGAGTLSSNTIGSSNTANGADALGVNTSGNGNSAFGDSALKFSEVGNFNTAVGASTLANNTADDNTATGFGALASNTSGSDNTAIGGLALQNNLGGAANTASGFHALFSNITGTGNTANGDGALNSNTGGNGNTAVGSGAGAAATGSSNVYIGAGMNGVAGESNACYIASIFGETSASGIPVLINSNNKLGTTTSSKRFKEDIRPMDNVSEALFALKPVTFRYKKEIDPAGTSQLGLVAEEVDQVNPDLVVRDKEGKPYSVRYDQVNAMLLNEFLKEHKRVEEQQGKIDTQQASIAALRATIAQQAKGMEVLTIQLKTRPQQFKE